MNNKKSFIGIAILAIVLVLGVGYAVVSTVELTFGGTVTVGDAPIKVRINNAQSSSTGDANVTHSWNNNGETSDTFTISDISLDEVVTITYTLKNSETDITATISESGSLTNSNTEYFEVTKVNNVSELNPGEEGTVTLKVKLKKTPITEANGKATISYKVKATPKSYTSGGNNNSGGYVN